MVSLYSLGDVGKRLMVRFADCPVAVRVVDREIVMVIVAPRGQATIFSPEPDPYWGVYDYSRQAAAVGAFMEQHKSA